ncbi:hypothetical protein CLOM_g11536 [Closterium sp. NIES-68]|nr:hypothetical protein CLOM_g11536 [Closterium sp. NIES-68]GJP73940.1 hypothetical protein CLOP_g4605 [Closterium sp. NIES-67]
MTDQAANPKALPALTHLPPLPAPCTRLEVDLYRLLRCCERLARSRSAGELQADPKFHNYVAYLRELFSQLQLETSQPASRPRSASAEAAAARGDATMEAYLQRITLLADLLDEHMLPDTWDMPDTLPLIDSFRWDALVPQDPDLSAAGIGAVSSLRFQQQQQQEAAGAGMRGVAVGGALSGRQGREALGLRSRHRQLRGRHGPSSKDRQSIPLPGSSLDDSSRAIITTHKNLHEELSDQMLTLAGQMKANSLAMEQKVKSSNKVLDATEESMERNVASLSRANQRASRLARQGFCTGCWTWMAMIVLLTMFVGMIMFIKMT